MKAENIARMLPAVFQRTLRPGNPLAGIVDTMEQLHAPAESILADIDAYFSPRRAPARMVPFLACWLGLDQLFPPSTQTDSSNSPLSTGLGCLRELTASAARLAPWRGTRAGMTTFLEIAIGTGGFEIEENTDTPSSPAFHMTLVAPHATRKHEALIQRIIETQKPAHATCELRFAASD